MQIISKEETLRRAAELGIGADSSKSPFQSYAAKAAYVLPTDTGKKTFLAKALIDSLVKVPNSLLWITGYGIWKSAENFDLFDGYRKYLGETRSLSSAPGHLFDEGDSSSVRSLLSLALYFYWDAVIVEGSGSAGIELSHDEYVDFYAKEDERLRQFEELAERLEMKRIID